MRSEPTKEQLVAYITTLMRSGFNSTEIARIFHREFGWSAIEVVTKIDETKAFKSERSGGSFLQLKPTRDKS